MPRLDLSAIPVRTGTIYPAPYDALVAGRSSQRLGEAGGLTQFGANLVTLVPGAWSSMRHWHLAEDEFVLMLSGDLVLIDDQGEHPMRPGDAAAFPANDGNGHHFVNRSTAPATFLVVGTRAPQETATYSDIDLMVHLSPGAQGRAQFTYKDGTPFQGPR